METSFNKCLEKNLWVYVHASLRQPCSFIYHSKQGIIFLPKFLVFLQYVYFFNYYCKWLNVRFHTYIPTASEFGQ